MMARERLAVLLLRGADVLARAPDSVAIFDRLRLRARDAGLLILPSGTLHLGYDELNLLGWLTLLQRQHLALDTDGSLDPALHDCLAAAAACLDAADIRLDYRNIVRAQGLPRIGRGRPPERATESRRPATRMEARAVAYVEARGTMPVRDLNALGISRQIVSIMCKKGLLQRVRHGVYATSRNLPSTAEH